jgi:hypothetical protein
LEPNLVKPKIEKEKIDTVDGWKYGGVTTITFSQVELINWAAGGQNSAAMTGLVNLFANYKKEKATLDNTLDIGYGIIKQGEDNPFIKNDDRFDFASKYGKEARKNWYYAGMLSFKSQLTATKNYADIDNPVMVSNFLAPAYLMGALGMDYRIGDKLTVFLAPVTGKITIVTDSLFTSKYGLEPGKKSRSEFGGYMKSMYKLQLMKNVTLTSKLDLFSNYLVKPENIDVNWELLIAMKINKYLSANIHTHLIYDDDVMIKIDTDNNPANGFEAEGPRVQFKEVFGLGLSVKF